MKNNNFTQKQEACQNWKIIEVWKETLREDWAVSEHLDQGFLFRKEDSKAAPSSTENKSVKLFWNVIRGGLWWGVIWTVKWTVINFRYQIRFKGTKSILILNSWITVAVNFLKCFYPHFRITNGKCIAVFFKSSRGMEVLPADISMSYSS